MEISKKIKTFANEQYIKIENEMEILIYLRHYEILHEVTKNMELFFGQVKTIYFPVQLELSEITKCIVYHHKTLTAVY